MTVGKDTEGYRIPIDESDPQDMKKKETEREITDARETEQKWDNKNKNGRSRDGYKNKLEETREKNLKEKNSPQLDATNMKDSSFTSRIHQKEFRNAFSKG